MSLLRATPAEQRQAKLQREHQAKLRRLAEQFGRKSMAKKSKQPTPAAPKATAPMPKVKGLGPLGVLLGLPAQVRLSAREQQPRPPAAPMPRKRERER
jgi:hypothetical protein